LTKAKKLVNGDTLQVDEKRKTLSVSRDGGVKQLKVILESFDKSKIHVTGMSLSKPTLDDVFLKLTGHKATEGNGEAQNAEGV
jgi:ABC-2 type transport system ATP-binding protein